MFLRNNCAQNYPGKILSTGGNPDEFRAVTIGQSEENQSLLSGGPAKGSGLASMEQTGTATATL